ncbi:MAG TPA: HD-GYP domain-containing protein [Polyangia bacterium]|nr:HD-GYP domain-containing protein [Polyangia bacterium]
MRDSHAQRRRPMDRAYLRGEVMIAGAYLVAAVALLLIGDTGGFSPATAAVYVAGIALAGQVRFDVGAGFTVPTQAIFVPMLFALPPATVPILVPLALAIGMLPQLYRGEVSSSWLLTAAGNSWFAIGPAVVLAAAGVDAPGSWGILVLALAAQFACDFVASAARERIFGGLGVAALAGEVRPIYAIDLALSTLGLAIAYAAVGLDSQLAAILLLAPLFGVLGFFSRERQERLAHLAELNDAYQGTALLLGDVVEADDAYTGEHSKSVVRLALEVCAELDLDHDRTRNVEFAALLHDVGKIVVPKEIIQKPGRLDEREWEIMRTHTIEGQRLLEKIGGFMSEVGVIVRASHEHWDGTGYPDGLSGEAIPLEARIVTACDAFNAMTTTRSYRKAMGTAAAVAELERCAGSQFDPAVVAAVLAVTDPGAVRVTGAAVDTVERVSTAATARA